MTTKWRVTVINLDWNVTTTHLDFTQKWEALDYAKLENGPKKSVRIQKIKA